MSSSRGRRDRWYHKVGDGLGCLGEAGEAGCGCLSLASCIIFAIWLF
ncbi:hypothetical protein FHS96_004249 [Sphingomonas zeicaulis]